MSIRTKVLGLVDVMMRVPPILVIDEILKIGMGLPTHFQSATNSMATDTNAAINDVLINNDSISSSSGGSSNMAPLESLYAADNSISINATSNLLDNSTATQVLEAAIDNVTATAVTSGMMSSTFGVLVDDLANDTFISDLLTLTSIKFIICFLGLMSAVCIFLLWTRHLVMVYMFLISLGLTSLSYWSNMSAITLMEKTPSILEDLLTLNSTSLFDTDGLIMSLVPHVLAQWFMGMLFAYIHLGPRYSVLQKFMPLIFTSPILIAMLPLPTKVIRFTPVVADIIPLFLTKLTLINSAMEAGKTIYNGYQYATNYVTNFGISALIENEWQRLNVPSVLRVFWTIRIAQEFIAIVMSDSITQLQIFPTIQKLLVDGCETLTAVLGMTSVISLICHYIGKAFQWYLLTFDNDEEKSLGTVSAVLFYILALQTGLTSLSPDQRFVRLCRNLCLLVTALLHFLHNIVSPILMSLSAARNPSRKRHVRALTVCAFLVVSPICLLSVLWSRHTASTWLLAVTAFSVEVVVKVLVSLATYALFLIDARRQSFWEKLDDYLYYVRAFGNSVEFCFGILLFFNGAWILIFESGGAIRAIMMCIHAYFNIWCEAKAGWRVFMKRRSAVHKISSLPEATPAQLRAFDDVCAICYQEMYSAKITRCRHFFHGVCLRKWLYVQDRCPLCHEIMMYTDRSDADNGENDAAAAAAANAAAAPPLQLYPHDDNANMQRPLPERPLSTTLARATSNSINNALTGSSSESGTGEDGVVSTSSQATATTSTASATNATTAASTITSTTAAAVATAAASNTTHSFRLTPDIGAQD